MGNIWFQRQRIVQCPKSFDFYYVSGSGATTQYTCARLANSEDPAKNRGCSPTCEVGNPINVGNGNKYQVETDYFGAGPFPLFFARTYNSSDNPVANGLFSDIRTIGANWRHSYYRYIELSVHPFLTGARVHRGDGKSFFFNLNNGAWIGEADIADRLFQLTDASGTASGWRYVTSGDEVELYDVDGKLLSITNRTGLSQTLTYDPVGRLAAVTDPVGRQLQFTYDALNRIATMTDPDGRLYKYSYAPTGYQAYETLGNLDSVTYPDTKVRTYVYNEAANTSGNMPTALTGIIDENDIRFATFKYGTGQKAWYSEHAGGADKVTINGSSVTDARNTKRTYSFEKVLGVIKNIGIDQPCEHCGDSALSRTYDGNGNIASRKDFNGHLTCYAYDLARNLETVRAEGLKSAACPSALASWTPAADTVQRKLTTEWHETWRLPKRVAEPKRLTTYVYHGDDGVSCAPASATVNGQPIGVLCAKTEQATSDASGGLGFSASPVGLPRTQRFTYNAHGQILSADGPRTDVADVSYYDYWPLDATCPATVPGASETGCRGQVKELRNAASHPTHFTEYNAHGQPLKITDANQVVTLLTYDARLRLTARSVGSETTHFQYDGVGQLDFLTLPDASVLDYTYDDAHRLTEIGDSRGNKIVYTLDPLGNRTKEETFDPNETLQRTLTRIVDPLNRLHYEVHP